MFKVSEEMVRDLLDTFNIELHFKFQIKNILGLFEKKRNIIERFLDTKAFFEDFSWAVPSKQRRVGSAITVSPSP